MKKFYVIKQFVPTGDEQQPQGGDWLYICGVFPILAYTRNIAGAMRFDLIDEIHADLFRHFQDGDYSPIFEIEEKYTI